MFLQRFYEEKLAQVGYLVGCQATGEALVLDPTRDVEPYRREASRQGLRITHVAETHIHADFVSGVRELAARTGARMILSAEGGTDWAYRFARACGAELVRNGDTFRVGRVVFEVLHTPGHTPEHICFRITDSAASDRPVGVFTGDFVFVGDVGRPDLLEKAAGVAGTMEAAARSLFRSLQAFKPLPDYLQIWPAHGAGSACGKALGAMPQSTLGYEKLVNWAFAYEDEDSFVRAVLSGQPEPPKYFAQMKRMNRDGPPVLGGFPKPERLPVSRVGAVLGSGAWVVDTRAPEEYARGHLSGTVNIPLNRSFLTWAGWLIPYDRDLYLIISEDGSSRALDEAVRDLALIGLDRVAGYFGAEAIRADGRGEPETIEAIDVRELAERMRAREVAVIDVRSQSEWEAGHLPGARHIALGYLLDRLDEIPSDRPIVVQCQSGLRSAIAASLLRARGITNVRNLIGGFARWQAAGFPVERPSA